MGDSPRYRPRSSYAQPGEVDTSLLDAEFLRSRAAAEPKPNRTNSTPLPEIAESKQLSPQPSVPSSYSPQRLTQAPIAESRPSLPRPGIVQDPFYEPLAPAGNVEYRAAPLRPASESNPYRKSLAPAPGLIGSKPAALSLGIDPSPRANPAPPRGLAPPRGIVPIPSAPLRPVDISAGVFERKSVPPATPPRTRPEVSPVIKDPKPLGLPTLSPAKNPLVRRNVSARFELLPDPKPRWNQLGVSAAGQLLVLVFALLIPIFFPSTMQTALKFDVIELMSPITKIPVVREAPKPPAVRPSPKPKPKPKIAPKAPELKPEIPELTPLVPQLSPKQPHVFLNLKPVVPKAHVVEEKAVELKPNLQVSEIVLSVKGPKAPVEDPKPAGLSGPAPGTVNAALNKVQTGGFGDPNGIGGPGNPNRRGNINQAGSPGLPGGPGYGNGTGGAQGVRGTLASDGNGKGAGGGGGAAAAAVSAGIAILYKPNPMYSVEGRDRKIQGDVVLEVIFLASGQMKVIRVVNGLGFGMDDQAIQAAQRIRFTPAMRDGKPVDFPAHIRIEFRLID